SLALADLYRRAKTGGAGRGADLATLPEQGAQAHIESEVFAAHTPRILPQLAGGDAGHDAAPQELLGSEDQPRARAHAMPPRGRWSAAAGRPASPRASGRNASSTRAPSRSRRAPPRCSATCSRSRRSACRGEDTMKRRRLGRSGIVVSEICLGTMTFGSMADEATSLRILDKAYDAGVDFLDVAETYPVPPDPKWAGRSEEIVGKWLAGRSRDAVFVATKVAGPGGGWFQTPVRHGRTALDRHSIARAVDASLARLRTDYIDLYQTHWPDPDLPIEETLEGLARVIDEGKVRAI